MQPQYFYRIERSVAMLTRGDDAPLKRIGKFSSAAEARAACEAHHAKACALARATNRPEPQKYYV